MPTNTKARSSERYKKPEVLPAGTTYFKEVPEWQAPEPIESTLNDMDIDELQRRVKAGEADHVVVNAGSPNSPDGGWVERNPEAVTDGENPMLAPYVDESGPETSGENLDEDDEKDSQEASDKEETDDSKNLSDNLKQRLQAINKVELTFVYDKLSTALDNAHDSIEAGNTTQVSVVRAALVDAKIFGDDTALIVGNIKDDDEVMAVLSTVKSETDPSTLAQNIVVDPQVLNNPGTVPTPDNTSGAPVPPPIAPSPGGSPNTPAPVPVPVPAAVVPTPAVVPNPNNTPNTPPPAPANVVPNPNNTPNTPPPVVVPNPNNVPNTPPPVNSNVPNPNNPPNTPSPTNPNTNPGANHNFEDKLDALDDARTAWAKVSAKRHRRVVFGLFMGRRKKYTQAKETYEQLSREVAKLELKDRLANEPDVVQKRAMIDLHWIEEQNRVRDEATEFVEDRLWWKVINGVSEKMNQGSKKARIAKRVGLGIVAGAAAAFTLGAGTAGAAAALMAFRFGNSQASKVAGGIGELTAEQQAALKNERVRRNIRTDDALLENRANSFDDQYEKDSKKQRRKRVGAVALSAATAVGGYTAGHFIGEGVHYVADKFGDTANAVGGGPGPDTDNPAQGTGSDAGQDVGSGSEAANDIGSTPDTLGTPDALPVPDGHDILNATDTFYVRPGEGWYETFQSMGIPKDNWTEVLQDAGPKLRDLGVAYFDPAQNEWMISQPGNLNVQAVQTIADSSEKFGYAFNKIT